MSSLLPLKPAPDTVSDRELEPRLVGFEDESAEQILSAVTSTTARRILNQLYLEPTTVSDIATELDSSVQNVSYHLNRLQDAGLVEVIETWYSEQGREMDVYAPTNSALVLFAGAERITPSLTTALSRVFGAVGILGVVSAIVHTRWSVVTPSPSPRVPGPPVQQPDPTMWETLVTFGTGPGGFVLGIGIFLILSLFVVWYWRTYHPARSRTQSM
ncbi:ArsR/SmtB family transcription factor [Halobacterium jilantaiense]|uniref:Helix-turn-helix domain-containing protein n=1 Tax=Halobacterium jilantaiense TaxID=355548 RepID=A0A1I0R3G2_9EURY|nr:helix-turn-helix domain-containing protein [Halobacterium jilantaiense]SEW34797.1 Helix-turn-helix domain-containing protein [Halobacterium jilantaiense]